jgi:hypothetical protein
LATTASRPPTCRSAGRPIEVSASVGPTTRSPSTTSSAASGARSIGAALRMVNPGSARAAAERGQLLGRGHHHRRDRARGGAGAAPWRHPSAASATRAQRLTA